MEKDRIEKITREYYKEKQPNLIITSRAMETFHNVIATANNIDSVSENELEKQIREFLSREVVVKFLQERQPLVSKVEQHVVDNVKNYFAENLPGYYPLNVYRKSNHMEDSYLYSVLAVDRNGKYACWTSWNESTQSMNHGHTGLQDKMNAMGILKENFHDITDEIEKYGIAESETVVNEEAAIQEKINQERQEEQRAIHTYGRGRRL